MRPADADGDPVLAIARALLSGDASRDEGLPELTGPNISAVELAHHLRSTGDPNFIFKKTLLELSEAQRRRKALLPHEEARLIIVIDQLEELFTRPEILAEDRQVFCELIEHLSESGAVWVIATMRSDFLYRGLESTTFRGLVHRKALVLISPHQTRVRPGNPACTRSVNRELAASKSLDRGKSSRSRNGIDITRTHAEPHDGFERRER
jgi:hypothetical protein